MADNLFGKTWSADTGRSLFTSSWKPTTETRLYEPVGEGYKLTVKGTGADGRDYEWGYTAQYDGNDHPVYGRPDVDAIEAYRISDSVTIGSFKKAGSYGAFYKRKVSADGRSLIVEMGGIGTDGKPYYNVVHYDAPSA